MRSAITIVPAALLSLTLISCTDSDTDTRTPASDPDTSSTQPVNQDRAITGGQPTPITTDPGAPGYDAGPMTKPVPEHRVLDRDANDRTALDRDVNDRTATDRDMNDRTVLDRDAHNRTVLNNDIDMDDDVDDIDAPRAADNTNNNTRDRDDTRLTPMDQGSSDSDLEITQAIRKTVVDLDDLSINAQNVKIITLNGVVTLRGPVGTAEERTLIANIAERTVGVVRVDNQLEIAR